MGKGMEKGRDAGTGRRERGSGHVKVKTPEVFLDELSLNPPGPQPTLKREVIVVWFPAANREKELTSAMHLSHFFSNIEII